MGTEAVNDALSGPGGRLRFALPAWVVALLAGAAPALKKGPTLSVYRPIVRFTARYIARALTTRT